MTWEYSGDPSTSGKDEVRFLVGDTDDGDPQMQDEEIEFLLTRYGDATTAAGAAARALAGKYTRAVTKAVGDLRIEYSDRAKAYRELAKFLTSSTGGGSTIRPLAYAGGVSIDDKRANVLDTDRVSPAFVRGRDDYEGAQDNWDDDIRLVDDLDEV